jgi:AcrR family transcriptional regulator
MTETTTACGAALSPEQAEARSRILGAAFRAFMEKGYARTSTLEIATAAKVSKRDLYGLVGNKQAIFHAGVSQGARRMSPPGSLTPPRDLAELKRTLTDHGARLLIELSGPVVVAVHRLAIAESETSPELAAELRAIGRANRKAVADYLAEAQGRGLIGPGDASAMAELYVTIITGGRVVERLLGGAAPTRAEAQLRAALAAEAVTRLFPA